MRREDRSRRRCAVRRIDSTLLQYTPHDCPALSWAAGQHCNLSRSDLLVKFIMLWSRTFLEKVHSHSIGNVPDFSSGGGSLFHYRWRLIKLTLGKWPTWCTITLHNTLTLHNPLHVSSNSVLIIRRSNCINTASDIVFSVSDRPVCRCALVHTCTPGGHLQRILYQMLC